VLTGNRVLSLLLIGFAAAFIFGLAHLFQLRFESGDVYPAYSSLRTDPLGTKALFESLQRVGDLTVQRNLSDLDKLDPPRSTTVFYVALKAGDLNRVEEQEFKQWESLALGGGRLVLSFQSTRTKPAAPNEIKPPNPPPAGPDGDADESENSKEVRQRGQRDRRFRRAGEIGELRSGKSVSPTERWGFQVAYQELPSDDKGTAGNVSVERRVAAPLPSELVWHSSMVFSRLDDKWRTLYARGAWPVLIEKQHGRGSVVLLSDSYLLSNEAMRGDRQPELLAWLVGSSKSVVFDETHLGVIENPGVMALARKYRLHGLFIGLAVLAGLFVWKNAVSFVPELDQSTAEISSDLAGARDSTAGFVNMLRRSVSAANLSSVCFEQWKTGHAREKSRGRFERMEALVQAEEARSPRDRDPVGTYERLARIWNERKL
jgi:hypothetical protein